MKTNRFVRFSIAIVVGAIAAIVCGIALGWTLAPLAGWDIFVVVLSALILKDFANDTPDETARMARQDALSSSLLDAVVLAASLASIGAVISLFAAKGAGPTHIVFGLISIVISWIVVQMLFTLRYVTLFYRDKEGGINFNNPLLKRPRFSDFAYLAFTIGMTYQVSDTVITDYRIRRTILMHALISFVFGVVIIASTINFLVGLAQ